MPFHRIEHIQADIEHMYSTFRSFSILAKLIIISLSLSLSLPRDEICSFEGERFAVSGERVCEKSAHDNKISKIPI